MSDETTQERPDGFRPRRVRPKDWLNEAIARGEVADPAVGGQPHVDYSGRTDVQVFVVPVAEAAGDVEDTE